MHSQSKKFVNYIEIESSGGSILFRSLVVKVTKQLHNFVQLYIHESTSMQTTLELQHYPDYSKSHVEETNSLTRIPFKPVPANELAVVPADSDPTAMAVLYGSEYVNGSYYLNSIINRTVANTVK